MRKLFAISAIALALAGCEDSDDVENTVGQITISGTAASGETLTATVTDENGVDSSAITYTWMADGSAISGATTSTLTITEALVGQDISVSASYTDNDDFAETVNSSTVSVANSAATFAGDTTATITKNASAASTGTITVTDADGADTVVAQSDVELTYGTFSISADGAWTYTLDTENTTVAALSGVEDTVVENISITSADGTSASIAITITGVAADKVAKISDSDDGDTGELYYKFESGTTTGKLSLSILYGELETETAYISLYDTEGSTKSLIGELSLNEGAYGLRVNTFDEGAVPSKNTSASSVIDEDAIDAPNFIAGEWIDIVMTWDTSSTTEVGTYTVMIDGTSYGPFTSQHPTPGVEVESMTVRLSSNGSLSADAVYVNDLNIYSDVAGTEVLLEEDFEDFMVGDSLDDSNDDSPFGSRTFEAEVVVYGMEDSSGEGEGSGEGNGGNLSEGDVAPGTSGNKVALIMDTLDDDAGELRYKLSSSADGVSSISKGKLTASFSKTAASTCTIDSNVKDAYIAIYGASTSSYNALVDLRIDGSDYDTDYAIRNKNQDGNKTVDLTSPSFTADTWTNVEITWDATNATADVGPLVSLSIDGTSVGDAWNSYSESVADLASGASTFVFKLGDTSANMADCKFQVDNVKIFSIDDAGAETSVYADNFESYDDGVSLDTDNDNSPYHSNSADVVVATEE
ncbi:VCBS domain-containing protein [Psychrosphaera aquimarina]|uniref:VCBS domain-containing protein n=1 Tax=Psychrosphaera aquimarina TaxID=2044854 RepID=A0ABU3R2T2_9GAMM|nr:VCBS domain-containing protein [Psychrosphaera aquimarina]MDU0113787.1 VCBS domain-containing protein [Psychrosphaera aquimarina]